MTTNKKPLLSEGNTRRMMGLAGLDALSNTFINERFVKEETQEEDLKLNEMPDDMAGEPPMPPETDMAPAEEDPATGGDVDISSLVAAITQAIKLVFLSKLKVVMLMEKNLLLMIWAAKHQCPQSQ